MDWKSCGMVLSRVICLGAGCILLIIEEKSSYNMKLANGLQKNF